MKTFSYSLQWNNTRCIMLTGGQWNNTRCIMHIIIQVGKDYKQLINCQTAYTVEYNFWKMTDFIVHFKQYSEHFVLIIKTVYNIHIIIHTLILYINLPQIHAYIYTYISSKCRHLHTNTYLYTYISSKFTHKYIHLHIYISSKYRIYTYKYRHLHTNSYIYIYFQQIQAFTHKYIYLHIYLQQIQAFTHIHLHKIHKHTNKHA